MTYMIVGGTPRAAVLRKLEIKVGGTWEWVETRKVRQVPPVVQKLNQGKIDHIIILNRFCSHAVIDLIQKGVSADKASRVHFLEKGYGLREIMEVL